MLISQHELKMMLFLCCINAVRDVLYFLKYLKLIEYLESRNILQIQKGEKNEKKKHIKSFS